MNQSYSAPLVMTTTMSVTAGIVFLCCIGHLVFVAKYRRGVFANEIARPAPDVCPRLAGLGSDRVEVRRRWPCSPAGELPTKVGRSETAQQLQGISNPLDPEENGPSLTRKEWAALVVPGARCRWLRRGRRRPLSARTPNSSKHPERPSYQGRCCRRSYPSPALNDEALLNSDKRV